MTKQPKAFRTFLAFRLLPAVMLLIVGLLVVAGFLSYSPSILKTLVERELASAGFVGSSVQRVSITPFRSIRLDSLMLTADGGGGVEIDVLFPHLTVTYHLVALVLERDKLRRALESRVAALRSGSDSTPFSRLKPLLKVIGDPVVAEVVHTIESTDTYLRITAQGQPVLEVADARILLQEFSGDTAHAGGSIEAGTATFASTYALVRPSALLRADSSGVQLTKIKGYYCEGTVRGEAAIDIDRGMLRSADFKIAGVKIEKWYSSQKNISGSLSGRLSAAITLDSSVLDINALRGGGTCRVKGLTADSIPLQRTLVVLLAIPQLSHIEFSTATVDFSIGAGRLLTRSIKGTGEPMDITSTGWIGFDGTFSQQLAAVLTGKFGDRLPELVQKSLLPAPDHRLMFDCVISGTLTNPSMVLNQQIVKRAVNTMFEKLGSELQRFFN